MNPEPSNFAKNNRQKRKGEASVIRRNRKGICLGCGIDNKTSYEVAPNYTRIGLSAHHLQPINMGGSHFDGLATLCEKCHRDIHTINGKFSWHHVNPELTLAYKNLLNLK